MLYDVTGLTELPVIGIVYVGRYCWGEERPQDGVCIREQNVGVNAKSALGWSGLTGLNHRLTTKSVVHMYGGWRQ